MGPFVPGSMRKQDTRRMGSSIGTRQIHSFDHTLDNHPCAAQFSVAELWQADGREDGGFLCFVFVCFLNAHRIEKKGNIKSHPLGFESPLCPDDSIWNSKAGNTLRSSVNNKSQAWERKGFTHVHTRKRKIGKNGKKVFFSSSQWSRRHQYPESVY